MPIANHTLPAGPVTFGQPLPPGIAFTGLQLGNLDTQTDVKRTWPDGSIRFAAVSAVAFTAGVYPLTAAPPPSGLPVEFVPSLGVDVVVAGTTYSASITGPAASTWLYGPVVSEGRWLLTPRTAGGTAHPSLRLYVDVRAYVDGSLRYDVAVESSLDQAGAGRSVYDVTIRVDEQIVYQKGGLDQPYLTRWRFTYGTDQRIVPDLTPAYTSNALPAYAAAVADTVDVPSGPTFGPLGRGGLLAFMPEHGGRPELAPYPDWTARYLTHLRPEQLPYVEYHAGNGAGAFPVHLRNSAGDFLTAGNRPLLWIDFGGWRGERPAGDITQTGPKIGRAHV